MLVQGIKDKGSNQDTKKEEKEGASIVTSLATSLENVLTRRILQEMMTTITTTTSRAMAIEGTTNSITKGREMLLLLEMEVVVLPRSRETPGMMKLIL